MPDLNPSKVRVYFLCTASLSSIIDVRFLDSTYLRYLNSLLKKCNSLYKWRSPTDHPLKQD